MKRLSDKTTNNARKLRKNMTEVEQLLWQKIRGRQLQNFRFRRQHPIASYIVDFVCLEVELIIELDGSQHIEQFEYDIARDKSLTQSGYKVLRFWNNEVLENMDGVLEVIRQYLSSF